METTSATAMTGSLLAAPRRRIMFRMQSAVRSAPEVIVLNTLGYNPISTALLQQTWVSSNGADTNACDRATPCKTFAGAISKTAPNGEIDCLDPGEFGTLTIT